jgi:integrase
VGKCNSKQLTQNILDKFILQRGNEVKRPTLNKDIRNLKTFINWCREKRYLNGQLRIKELKENERPVKSLNDIQIRKLLSVAEPYHAMKMRILLSLGTGLRRGDVESIKVNDIDFMQNCITTVSRKTGKSMGSRSVPDPLMKELKKYVNGLNSGHERLFNDNFSYKQWRKICEDSGIPNLRFHDLRKTFGSVLAQRGVFTAVTQRLLEHSSSALTNKIYTNVDPYFDNPLISYR